VALFMSGVPKCVQRKINQVVTEQPLGGSGNQNMFFSELDSTRVVAAASNAWHRLLHYTPTVVFLAEDARFPSWLAGSSNDHSSVQDVLALSWIHTAAGCCGELNPVEIICLFFLEIICLAIALCDVFPSMLHSDCFEGLSVYHREESCVTTAETRVSYKNQPLYILTYKHYPLPV
jgi:hypothetical protein